MVGVLAVHTLLIGSLLTALENKPVKSPVSVETIIELELPKPLESVAPEQITRKISRSVPENNKNINRASVQEADNKRVEVQRQSLQRPVQADEAEKPQIEQGAVQEQRVATLNASKAPNSALGAGGGDGKEGVEQKSGKSAGERIDLPISNAGYLQNPPPPYPRMSLRLGEQGRVIVRVYVDRTGKPIKVVMGTSSGFERLDKAALDAVAGYRFVPGTRSGVPEEMWVDVPLVFKIN